MFFCFFGTVLFLFQNGSFVPLLYRWNRSFKKRDRSAGGHLKCVPVRNFPLPENRTGIGHAEVQNLI
jgi:hypothetical protein